MITILAGIVIAALIFSAFIWQIYRAVTTTGIVRWNAVGLVLATLAVMGTRDLDSIPLIITSAVGCILFAPIAIWADPRWSKLLPMVLLALGFSILYFVYVLSTAIL
jgi:hypothetical protein